MMFSKSKQPSSGGNANVVSTVIGPRTAISGNVQFDGSLLVEGKITGDVKGGAAEDALLILEDGGHIEGDISVTNIIVNGQVNGDIHVSGQAELSANAVINGNVYYDKLEMLNGARVNGSLVHQAMSREPESVPDAPAEAAAIDAGAVPENS